MDFYYINYDVERRQRSMLLLQVLKKLKDNLNW